MDATKTKVNFALVLHTTLEDVSELKKYIKSALPDSNIVFQTVAPKWEKLYIKKDNNGGGGQR